MVTLGEYSRLVSAIHAAAVTPEHWLEAIEAVRDTVGATTAAIIIADGFSRDVKSASVVPEARQSYREYYRHIDYVLDAVEHGPVGLIHSGRPLVTLDARSEFNTDWMRPFEMDDGVFVRLTAEALPTCFLVAAPRRDEAFATPERVELVSALIPHLQQALRTEKHLDGLRREAADAAAAIDTMHQAVVIVGPGSAVHHANSAAEATFTAGAGVGVRFGCLRADSMAADAELRRGITHALGATDGGARSGSSFLCPRAPGERPLIVHVVPYTSPAGDGCDPRALVLVVDPASRPEPPHAMLRRLFGLTKAESDVALRVARGSGLAPISEELSLSIATVKTHLQHVFEKTDTHRQAELVRLLVELVP